MNETKREEQKTSGKSLRNRRFIGLAFIAIVIAVAIIAGIQEAADRREKEQERKIGDLMIVSMDREAALMFPDCVYDEIATVDEMMFARICYRYAACESEREFYDKVVFQNSAYRGTLREEDGSFLPASAKEIPGPAGYTVYLANNHFFLLNFTENAISGYRKYILQLSEATLEVYAGEDGSFYLAFPATAALVDLDSFNISETKSFRWDQLIVFPGYDGLKQFYGVMDEPMRYFDEANKIIYVRLSGGGTGSKRPVAKLVPSENEVSISVITLAEARRECEEAFAD